MRPGDPTVPGRPARQGGRGSSPAWKDPEAIEMAWTRSSSSTGSPWTMPGEAMDQYARRARVRDNRYGTGDRLDKDRLSTSRGGREWHGGAEEASCRVIDDGLAGGQNAFTGTSAYHRACDLDMWVLLLRIAAEFFGSPLQGSTSDFKSAYRQVTAAPEQARYFVVAMWDPASRRVAYELAVSQLFGSGAAPPSFRGFRHGACLSLAAPLLCLQTTAWTTSSLLRLRFLVSRHFILGVCSP